MLTLEQFRMRKKTGPFDDKVKTDAQKMAKQPKYKGSTSKLEADIRKKHGDKNANHFVIQNIIRKHAETNEAVTSADRTPQNVTGSDGKVRTRMVPTTKKSDTSEVYARPKGKAFKDLARKEMGEDLDTKDVKTVKKVIKGLKGAVKAHAGQVKSLTKDIQDQNTNPHDDEGANHIIMQLRKSVSLRGMRPVEFKDGKKVKVSMADAQKFLTKYNKSKPMDKEKMQAMAMKSHDGFKKALGESVINELTPAQKQMKMKAQGGIRGRQDGGAAKDARDLGIPGYDHQGRGLKKTHKPGDRKKGSYVQNFGTAQARKGDAETGKISQMAYHKSLRQKDPRNYGPDSKLSDLRRKHQDKTGRDMQGRKIAAESVQEDMSDFERRMRMMRQAGSSQKINQKKRDDKEKKSMAAKAAVDMRARRNEVKEDRMAGKYKKGQTIVRGQWPNPDKWAEEYIMPNADKKGVKIYSSGPSFVIEKL